MKIRWATYYTDAYGFLGYRKVGSIRVQLSGFHLLWFILALLGAIILGASVFDNSLGLGGKFITFFGGIAVLIVSFIILDVAEDDITTDGNIDFFRKEKKEVIKTKKIESWRDELGQSSGASLSDTKKKDLKSGVTTTKWRK